MELKTLIEEYEKKRKEFTNSCLDLMKIEFNKFFEENPEVKRIYWTQYAPHFNDGEPCEFGVYEVYFSCFSEEEAEAAVKEMSVEEQRAAESKYKDESSLWIGYEMTPAMSQMEELIHSIPEEIMKDVFSPDAAITVTKDAINIEDYSSEHD